MYSRILLAYDGSREGLIALREGALLAKRCGAQVFLLSVLPASSGLQMAEGVYPGAINQQVSSYKELLARGVTVLKQLGLNPVAKLVVGEPAPQIGMFAKEIGADLVVLGHRPQSLMQRWWSGASGGYVSEHVGCSLLVGRKSVSDEAFEAELQNLSPPSRSPPRSPANLEPPSLSPS
jgi:nucleotide-binding universal stress UspA family protein